MAGKHATHDRKRFARELLRLILLVLVIGAVIIAAALWVSSLLDSNGDTIPIGGSTSSTTTIVESTTSTTESVTTTTTTAAATTTSSSTTTIPETTTTLAPVLNPEEITVIVLNSTTEKGMAGRLTSRLADLGYDSLEADNYSPLLDTSAIWYGPGLEREAAILAEQIPDATVEPFVGGEAPADITVVLGASFSE